MNHLHTILALTPEIWRMCCEACLLTVFKSFRQYSYVNTRIRFQLLYGNIHFFWGSLRCPNAQSVRLEAERSGVQIRVRTYHRCYLPLPLLEDSIEKLEQGNRAGWPGVNVVLRLVPSVKHCSGNRIWKHTEQTQQNALSYIWLKNCKDRRIPYVYISPLCITSRCEFNSSGVSRNF